MPRPASALLVLLAPALVLATSSCARAPLATPATRPAPATAPRTAPAAAPAVVAPARPRPYPVVPLIDYRRAVKRGTRTATGRPGPHYWTQWANYTLEVQLDPRARRVDGSGQIEYHNRSPDTLSVLYLYLIQNFHAPGVPRGERAQITGGMHIQDVRMGGEDLPENPTQGLPGFSVDGTLMKLTPPHPIPPGGVANLALDWWFIVPQRGVGGRMGYSDDDDFFIGYFYPQMAVYDDVVGWNTDPFMGTAEFYADFGNYDLTVTAPEDWIVNATGRLQNPDEVLQPEIVDRLREAESSDTVVHVVTPSDFGHATQEEPGGELAWRFVADSVHDVAFAVTRASNWDAARTPVGEHDGVTDYTRVDAIWRPSAHNWKDAARFAQNAIAFHSRNTGEPYPWPHATAVEGGGIIGGGMEFPMMTLIGDYNARGDSALYAVVAHELGHMWIPMLVASNERRYGWMDEGTTTFEENQARDAFYPGSQADGADQQSYIAEALSGYEGPIMRWSDYQYSGRAYGVASYSKPASVLVALRAVLGDSVFMRAYRAFFRRWAWKHPYPWDFFRTFDNVSGRNLGWFWRSWYYESTFDGHWDLDQAVDSVEPGPKGTRIVIRDDGWVPMPVPLTITRSNGAVIHDTIPVAVWLAGATRTAITVPSGPTVVRVEIDAARAYPDVDRANNLWVLRP